MIPSVCYRFGERNDVIEFVTPKNPDIREIAIALSSPLEICNFIKNNFTYPMNGSLPSTNGISIRFSKACFKFFYKKAVEYMWSFPNECLQQKVGICIDTANLCASLLLAIGVKAWVCLGEIREADTEELIGYHAWVAYNDKIVETTVHSNDSDTILHLESAYNKESDWVKSTNVYYVEHGRYNNKEYIGTTVFGETGGIISMLSLPKSALKFYRPFCNRDEEKNIAISNYKLWQKDEKEKLNVLEKAYARWPKISIFS